MNAPLHVVGSGSLVLPSSLPELTEEYCTHAVKIRGVQEIKLDSERLYLRRFCDWFGPPDSPVELFSRINADSVAQCLIDYAGKHTSTSRRWMQDTVRLFLRFAYHAGYVEHDLSALTRQTERILAVLRLRSYQID